MLKRKSVLIFLLVLAIASFGCTAILRQTSLRLPGRDGSLRTSGVVPLVVDKEDEQRGFEDIDLVELLTRHASNAQLEKIKKIKSLDASSKEIEQKSLKLAFEIFYKNNKDKPERRNRVQDRIMAASEQRCGEYIQMIRLLRSHTNFWTGAAATVLGGVGAILTPASTARALAGASGIVSGTRAEFDQQFFASLATGVIVKGILQARLNKFDKIQNSRFEKNTDGKIIGLIPMDHYTVEQAIGDAIEYHGLCNIISGLKEADDSIKGAGDVGLDRASVVMDKVIDIRKKLDQVGAVAQRDESQRLVEKAKETDVMGKSLDGSINKKIGDFQKEINGLTTAQKAKLGVAVPAELASIKAKIPGLTAKRDALVIAAQKMAKDESANRASVLIELKLAKTDSDRKKLEEKLKIIDGKLLGKISELESTLDELRTIETKLNTISGKIEEAKK